MAMTGLFTQMDPWKIITAIRYAYPGLVLLYFVVASTVTVCTLQTLSLKNKDQQVRRDIIIWLMLGVVCQYIIHAPLLLVRSIVQTDWVLPPDEVVYLISSALVWGVQFLSLVDAEFPVWYPYYGNWIAAIIVEIALLVGHSLLRRPVDSFDFISISLQSLRLCNFILLPCVYVAAGNRKETYETGDAERQSLLRNEFTPKPSASGESGPTANEYGATIDSSNDGSKKKTDEEEANEDSVWKRHREAEEKIAKRLKADGNWWTYCKGFFIFFPYIWPVHSKILQFRAILTGVCLLTTNSLNLLVPRQLGVVTDALVAGNGTKAWVAVATYSALTFVNSSACIGWLKFWLWQPLDQYSYDALNAAAHSHVMSLSSEFHETRSTGDIHQTISQGKGIRKIVDTCFFSLGPMFIDLFLVFAYLYYLFGPYMALDLAATTLFYLYTTAKLVALAANRRRIYHMYYRKEWYSSLSSVGNWRIASYFNQIPHEHSQHHSIIKAHLRSEKSYDTLYYIITVSQTLVMTLGLLGACFLAAYQVIHKTRSPGDFVILLSYWAQVQSPLAVLSNLYKTLSESLMDAERMLEIFQTKPNVADDEDAKPLILTKGEIEFKNVKFAYDDRKEILKGINLKIGGGSTVAIVGETGSGKSTTLKLLHRFYDPKSGSIEIDGQDIRKLTMESLRENVAIVPQDPTLFNETIMTNLRYARLTATKEEVYEACKSARIHEKIMSLPDGYEYKVGNSAVKLSGGEQQRLAIARALLKKSAIILLDEATSSVDTETEQRIQEALNKLCSGRTTVIVAHRLSTIMRADHIVVMKDGSIIEHGSHDDLLRLKGKYFDLWANQIQLLNHEDKSSNEPDEKPDAPACYSYHLRGGTERTEDSASGESTGETKDGLEQEKDQKKQEEKVRKSHMSFTKKAAKNTGKHTGQLSAIEEPRGEIQQSGSSATGESSQDSATSGTDNKNNEPKFRRSRVNSRRHLSKSEPMGQDGTNDSEDQDVVDSGESQPLLGSGNTHRNQRVSAPSDLISGQEESCSSSLNVRSRRTHHWRTRNLPGSSSGSASTSGATSSVDISMDEAASPNPPTISPVGGVPSARVKVAPSSK